MSARVYLDHAASAPLDPRAGEALLAWQGCANPSALHASGRKAAHALSTAREQMAQFLGVQRSELTFTSGGTEANNLAIHSIGQRHTGGHLLASPTEHPSVLEPLKSLAQKPGWSLDFIELDPGGRVLPDRLKKALTAETRLVAVQWANNETGALHPLDHLVEICNRAAVPLLVDAAQAAPVLELRPAALGIDFLSLSAHKFHGPKGAGLLYCRGGLKLSPQLLGGGQERGLRSGTENVAAMVGMAEAARWSQAEREERLAHLTALRQTLERELQGLGRPVLPERTPHLPQIASFFFAGHKAQRLLMQLDLEGFEAGSGSACSIGQDKPSHVLTAMGFSPEEAGSVLRFSLGKGNQPQELQALGAVLRRILETL